MTHAVSVVLPRRRSQRWEAAAYWAAAVTAPGPDADFGMPRWLAHDLVTIAYQDRMKAALKAVRERDLLRLIALWPLLARSARSPWDLLRGALEAAGIIDRRPNANGPPGRHTRMIIICCPRTGPPAGTAAVGIALLDRTGGAVP